jgi:Domain of unknown function (DUF4055)
MGIEALHPQYAARLHQWQRCQDCFDGTDAVKARKDYIPKLSGQTELEYNGYLTRALFYGAMARTVQGLVGALVRLAPALKASDTLKKLEDSLTIDGLPLNEVVKAVASQVLVTNRCGLLVDRGQNPNDRPYIALYNAMSITNWDDDGDWIVLKESYYKADPADKYTLKEETRYRELVLLEGVDSESGVYQQNIWEKVPDASGKPGTEYVITSTIAPTMRGQPLTEIPWTWVTDRGQIDTVEKPPLLDMVDVNLSHFRNSADLEHGMHFTALPTPWVSGAPPAAPGQAQPELRIGSATAWLLPDPQSRAGYLEFAGAGLGSIREAMAEKVQTMATLGAQLIAAQRNLIETAETARIHQSGEVSHLTSIAVSVENGIEAALQRMADWENDTATVELRINRDFIDTRLQAGDLVALLQTWQAGGISLDSFLWNLKEGELLAPDTSIEDEKAKIDLQKGAPAAIPLPGARANVSPQLDPARNPVKLVSGG